jgi:hypothetical protein
LSPCSPPLPSKLDPSPVGVEAAVFVSTFVDVSVIGVAVGISEVGAVEIGFAVNGG